MEIFGDKMKKRPNPHPQKWKISIYHKDQYKVKFKYHYGEFNRVQRIFIFRLVEVQWTPVQLRRTLFNSVEFCWTPLSSIEHPLYSDELHWVNQELNGVQQTINWKSVEFLWTLLNSIGLCWTAGLVELPMNPILVQRSSAWSSTNLWWCFQQSQSSSN